MWDIIFLKNHSSLSSTEDNLRNNGSEDLGDINHIEHCSDKVEKELCNLFSTNQLLGDPDLLNSSEESNFVPHWFSNQQDLDDLYILDEIVLNEFVKKLTDFSWIMCNRWVDLLDFSEEELSYYIKYTIFNELKKKWLIWYELFTSWLYISDFIHWLILWKKNFVSSNIDLLQSWNYLWSAENSLIRHLIWEWKSRRSPYNSKDLIRQAEFYYWLHFSKTNSYYIYSILSKNLSFMDLKLWWFNNMIFKMFPSFRLI